MTQWNPFDSPIDYVKIAGKRSPGIAEVVGLGSPRKWDERNGPGGLGGTLVFMKAPLRHFSVLVRVYSREEWRQFDFWVSQFETIPKRLGPAGGLPGAAVPQPKAYEFWHPFAVRKGIKSVVIEDVLQPVEVEPTVWMHEVKLIEFRKWLSVGYAKPEASKVAPVDPVDQRIERLTAQVQELAK